MKDIIDRRDEYKAEWDAVVKAWQNEQEAIMKKYRDKYGPFDAYIGHLCSQELRPLEKKVNAKLDEIKAKYREAIDD